jgi:glycosyltransferase involved in cell wall biosynthesis
MKTASQPLVSIVTPVYNGAEHLAECIESVLAQTYQNWDYTIVNNCSTDATMEIARRFAAKDRRIRIHENQTFLRAIPNHNVALRLISAESEYCKVVFGDDWIYPDCLEQMVAVAEEYPSVGIVGAYGLQGKEVMWAGLPYPSTFVPGNEVCRLLFFEDVYVFGTATSLLYRADLVRNHDPFYNESNLHADMEACVVLLKSCDFGFVHQILTFKRERPGSLGTISEDINTLIAGKLHDLVTHGSDHLTPEEFRACLNRHVSKYYNFLAVSVMRGRRDPTFWNYHKRKLTEAGIGFSHARLIKATLTRFCRAVLNPNETIDKARGEVSRRNCRGTGNLRQSAFHSRDIRPYAEARLEPIETVEPKGRRV